LRIEAIETKDFKALGGQRRHDDLPDGIIGIVGDNGQGKSTLLTAVAYALYGPEVLDTGLQDVVTWGQDQGYAAVEFSLNDNTYKVQRSAGKGGSNASLYRDDQKVASSPTMVTAEIEKLLALDRVGFLASVFSRQEDLLGIGSLQPAKRQTTVLRLLQFDRVDDGLKNLAETNRDLNKELSVLRQMSVRPEVKYDPNVLRQYEHDLKEFKRDLENAQTQVDAAVAQMKAMETKVAEYNDYAQKKNRLDGELKSARTAMFEAFRESEVATPTEPVKPDPWIEPDEFLVKERQYHLAEDAVSKSVCPTCKRPYDAADSIAIAAEADSLRAWVQQWRPVYEAVRRYQSNLTDWEYWTQRKKDAVERSNIATRAVEAAEDKLRALKPVTNVTVDYAAAQTRLRRDDQALARVKSNISIVETHIQHGREALAREAEREKLYVENDKEIKRLEREVLINGQTQLLMQQYKASLIANVIPSITERASSLITDMTEGKYTELNLTPQYDIEYRNDQGDLKSFGNLSGGEKDVFALALRLAIADLKAGSVGILVLDEVLESLDPGRQEATWASLERLTNRYNQIFVITHVDTFKDRAPYSITV
jgi:DNA repair exonuclease SbcCD ATPase subunit